MSYLLSDKIRGNFDMLLTELCDFASFICFRDYVFKFKKEAGFFPESLDIASSNINHPSSGHWLNPSYMATELLHVVFIHSSPLQFKSSFFFKFL